MMSVYFQNASIKMASLGGRTVLSHNVVNVRSYDDYNTPWISGCAVMPGGFVVLCDYNNNKLKLLNSCCFFFQKDCHYLAPGI